MKYLLDSNTVIPLLNGRNPKVTAAVLGRPAEELCVSSMVMHELFYGAYKGARVEISLRSIQELQFAVLPFDVDDAQEAGRVRAQLATQGQIIGPYDLLIAGQALRRGLTVVTGNLREFERVPGLRCEDWSR